MVLHEWWSTVACDTTQAQRKASVAMEAWSEGRSHHNLSLSFVKFSLDLVFLQAMESLMDGAL